jgi:signal transduction histidine kinase/ActR/RegA family two-component response regulator
MFSSLKLQLIVAFLFILLLSLGQQFVSLESQGLLSSGLSTTQHVAQKVILVKTLEKDVSDLQRSVLIYQENNSKSVLKRFNGLMVEVNKKLDVVKTFIDKNDLDKNHSTAIASMQEHLDSYQDNFEIVVAVLSKRDKLFNENIVINFQHIKENLNNNIENFHTRSTHNQKYEKLLTSINQLQIIVYEYALHSTYESVEKFNICYSEIVTTLSEIRVPTLKNHIENLSKDFIKLTQVTRNYQYLVNVVMSGSANEFLYLATNLSDIVFKHMELNNNSLNTMVENSAFRSNVMFIIGLILLFLIVMFVVVRLIFPIQKVTKVFDVLASNQELDEELVSDRIDEIGKLMHSANVFKNKNIQTNTLLQQYRQLNEQLVIETAKAEQATNAKSMFLANMSHEIRTPINGIVGLVELLSLKKLPAEEREYLSKIRYSTNILMSVINDILDFSKMEAGKLEIETISFNPRTVFENTIEVMVVKSAEKNINIHCDIPYNLPLNIKGDPVRLSQILLNLSNNAMKFTEIGYVALNIAWQLGVKEHSIDMVVDIIDTGIGISDEQQKNIFNDFEQADGSTSRHYGGTGLGLSISKQLAKLMGGDILLSSVLNEGSKFSVHIPFQYDPTELSPSQNNTHNGNFYFCQLGDLSLSLDIISDYVNKLTIVEASVLFEESTFWPKNSVLFVNVIGQLTQQQEGMIKALLLKEIHIGFILETHAENITECLGKIGATHIVHHPLLPSRLLKFIKEIESPVTLSVAEKEKEEAISLSSSYITQFTGHVLLVEDNSINQLVAGKVLQNFGLTYDIAQDGEQAFKKVVQRMNDVPQYDLVFMDIQMPILDGYKATMKIRKYGLKDLIICGLSANAMRSDIEKGVSAGMNEYITKPLNTNEIKRVLEKYLIMQADKS